MIHLMRNSTSERRGNRGIARAESALPSATGALRRPQLLKSCLRWTHGDWHEAEDLLGDAWLQLFENARRGAEQPLDIRAFLLTIINNLGRDKLRRARRWKRVDVEACDSIQALTSSAEHLVWLRQRLARAELGLGYVGEKPRAALLLRTRGIDYVRIADLLSTSQANARKLVETARVQLARTALRRPGKRVRAGAPQGGGGPGTSIWEAQIDGFAAQL